MRHGLALLVLLGVIAVAGIAAGTVLASLGYSASGAFAVASACVGVLGTIAAEERYARRHDQE